MTPSPPPAPMPPRSRDTPMRRQTRRQRNRQENPNQLIYTLALSMGVVMLWQWLFPPPAPVQRSADTLAAQQGAAQQGAAQQGAAQQGAALGLTDLSAEALAARARAATPAVPLKTLTVNHKQAVQVNSHGQLSEWQILEPQYLRRLRGGAAPYALARPADSYLADRAAEGGAAPFLPPALELVVSNEPLVGAYEEIPSAPGVDLTLRLRARGVEVTRAFTLAADRYAVIAAVQVKNLGAEQVPVRLLGVTRALQDHAESEGSLLSPPLNMLEALCAHGGDLERDALGALAGKVEDKEPMSFLDARWVGVNNRYFMSALSVERPFTCEESIEPRAALLGAALPGTSPVSAIAVLTQGDGFLKPGATLEERVTLYGGPKMLEALNAHSPSLGAAIDFGVFTPICLPMLFMMRTFFDVIPNWGVAIILLTILVKLLTLPLTVKQFKSMAAMKKIQPEMQRLKEQYQQTDPVRFQQETMALYKQHGVNPLAGCLPMLAMMPIYFALYRTIYTAVELYQAEFFGWLHDLSMPDPYFVSPVLLGGLMLAQARLNPTPGMDETQRKMMTTFMPLMFSAMMLFLPSGLVVYIFVNTILGIIQQVYTQKKMEAAV